MTATESLDKIAICIYNMTVSSDESPADYDAKLSFFGDSSNFLGKFYARKSTGIYREFNV